VHPAGRGEFEAPAHSELGLDGGVDAVHSTIAPLLIGMDAGNLAAREAELRAIDGTPISSASTATHPVSSPPPWPRPPLPPSVMWPLLSTHNKV